MADAGAGLRVDSPGPGIQRLLLDRPERRNALDADVVDAMATAFGDCAEAEIRVIVLGSTTRGVFCSGADLDLDDATRAQVSEKLYALYELMIGHSAIVISAVDGAAVGGGAQLAIASDLRLLSPGAWVRIVGPGHGLAVGSWGLPSLVGRGRAFRLCLTGERVDAAEAARIGLADRVCDDDPLAAATELAGQLTALDADAVRRVKRIVVAGTELASALRAEAEGNRRWAGAVPRR